MCKKGECKGRLRDPEAIDTTACSFSIHEETTVLQPEDPFEH